MKTLKNCENMKTYITIYFILILLTGCAQSSRKKYPSSDKAEIFIVDIDSALKNISNVPFKLSEFIDTIKYISLETNKESVFGGLRGSSFMTTAEFVYADLKKFRFKDGKYICSIGKNGRGPGEFTMAIGSATDLIDKRIFVIDNWIRKVFIYDSSNNFIKSIDISPEFRNIGYLGNDNIILLRDASSFVYPPNNNPLEYQILNSQKGQISHTRKIKALIDHVNEINGNMPVSYGIGRNCKWYFDSIFQLYESFSDTVFSIDASGISVPRYSIKRSNYKPPLAELTDNNSFFKNQSKYILIRHIFETPKFLFINFSKGLAQGSYIAGFDKHTRKTKIVPVMDAFENDISFIKIGDIENIQGINDGFSYLNSKKWNDEFITLLKSIPQSDWTQSSKALYNLLKTSRLGDNGIVCLLKFKY